MQYMTRHLAEPLSLARMAAVVHMSPTHFGHRFKAATGQTPYQMLLATRFTKAQELLRTTTWTIAMIASEVGFADHSHFSQLFRQRCGMTPEAYRWQAQAMHSLETLPRLCALWPKVSMTVQLQVLELLEAKVVIESEVML